MIMMGKVEYQLNPKQILSVHALHAGDETKVRDITEEAYDIHNTKYNDSYGWLTLKSFFTPRLYARTLLYSGYISHKRNGNTNKPHELSDKLYSKLSDSRSYYFTGLKRDWLWDLSDRLSLKSGFDFKQLNADYDYSYESHDVRVHSNDSLFYYSNAVDIQKNLPVSKCDYIFPAVLNCCRSCFWKQACVTITPLTQRTIWSARD